MKNLVVVLAVITVFSSTVDAQRRSKKEVEKSVPEAVNNTQELVNSWHAVFEEIGGYIETYNKKGFALSKELSELPKIEKYKNADGELTSEAIKASNQRWEKQLEMKKAFNKADMYYNVYQRLQVGVTNTFLTQIAQFSQSEANNISFYIKRPSRSASDSVNIFVTELENLQSIWMESLMNIEEDIWVAYESYLQKSIELGSYESIVKNEEWYLIEEQKLEKQLDRDELVLLYNYFIELATDDVLETMNVGMCSISTNGETITFNEYKK